MLLTHNTCVSGAQINHVHVWLYLKGAIRQERKCLRKWTSVIPLRRGCFTMLGVSNCTVALFLCLHLHTSLLANSSSLFSYCDNHLRLNRGIMLYSCIGKGCGLCCFTWLYNLCGHQSGFSLHAAAWLLHHHGYLSLLLSLPHILPSLSSLLTFHLQKNIVHKDLKLGNMVLNTR